MPDQGAWAGPTDWGGGDLHWLAGCANASVSSATGNARSPCHRRRAWLPLYLQHSRSQPVSAGLWRAGSGTKNVAQFRWNMVPEAGIEPARPLFTKRRILSPMCLPISPLGHRLTGGATRSRTGLDGFAIRCITDLLSRQICFANRWLAGSPSCHLQFEKKRETQFSNCASLFEFGAGKESRTLDLNLGKVALYQLSYSRVSIAKL